MGFYADPLSVTWILLVTGVGSLIHLYSIGYMHGDARFSRFFAYLNLFVGVDARCSSSASSFLVTFLGWEGVGLCSYLLVVVLVRAQLGGGGGQEGVRHQPRRRRRLPARDVPDLRVVRVARTTPRSTPGARGDRERHRHRDRVAAARRRGRARARRSRCTSGCPTRWRARRRCRRSSTPPPWSPRACSCCAAPTCSSTSSSDAMTVVAWVGGVTALLAGTVAIMQPDIKRVLAYSTDQPARLHVPRRRHRRVHARPCSW